MSYITNKELLAMDAVLSATRALNPEQRARVFAWVNAAITDAIADEEKAEADLNAWRARNRAEQAAAAPANLIDDRAAVTTLEYGIIASILGLVLVGIFHGFGHTLSALFSHVATSI